MARREFYEELPSTQDRALALARVGAEDGSIVVARRQSQGRGRGERSWASPPGGLYLSVVLQPPAELRLLALAIGAEIAGTLAERYGARLRLKWPNDLLAVDGSGRTRKLAGILVDVVAGPHADPFAVAGVGVNAVGSLDGVPSAVVSGAVTLSEIARSPVSLDRLETEVASSAIQARDALRQPQGEASVLARCAGLLYGRGEPVSVDGVPSGLLQGLGADGSLLLMTQVGPRSILVGDVRVGVGS
jgi:BirA family transcriptional regulator, biotin operon repressor / biotin---[acetyl-CoA-carboxylase] ligase